MVAEILKTVDSLSGQPRILGIAILLVCLSVIVWILEKQYQFSIPIPPNLKQFFPWIILFLTTVLAFWGIYLTIYSPPIKETSIEEFYKGIYLTEKKALIAEDLNKICASSEPFALTYSFYRKNLSSLYQGRMVFPGGKSEDRGCNKGKFIDYYANDDSFCQGTVTAENLDFPWGSELAQVELKWNPGNFSKDRCSDEEVILNRKS
jgi:hypothetical protein